ncbi:hypothetical protein FO519_009408 [Halicephalobus sp. NKZ332]|nr:hypothetical protein FO519_009408 [Halicephalobus sp. NKZ332]
MSSKTKIIIIGAGPTGIGAISRISDLIEDETLKDVEVVLLEKESFPGGLASTVTDQKGFSWDLGVHVTGASRYPVFLKTLQSVVPEWHYLKRTVKADMKHVLKNQDETPEGNYVPYPVQASVPYFPEDVKEKCIEELQKRFEENETKEFANFEEFSLYFFGRTLQEIFIRPYNEKVWTVKLDEMNCKWVEGRVPKVDLEAIQVRSVLDKEDLIEHDTRHDRSFFRYPADCLGMGELWKRVVAKYPTSWFKFNSIITEIDPEKKEIKVKTKSGSDSVLKYDFLISTMPLTLLGKITGLCPNLNLKHSKQGKSSIYRK